MHLPKSNTTIHPLAWWIWALGLAITASLTSNILLLVLLLVTVCIVVFACRTDEPCANAFHLYLWLALAIILIRILFRIIFGGSDGYYTIVVLPQLTLPTGIQLLGEVTLESLASSFADGLRLGTIIVCIGAANALANAKRLLRSFPPALHEIGTILVVAISVFPQLAESVIRVRKARLLRGSRNNQRRSIRLRFSALRAYVIPVLEDALTRSLQLAASMDARGYGRSGAQTKHEQRLTGALLISGLIGSCIGMYATLDSTAPRFLAAPMLICGSLLALVGMRGAGKRVNVSRYRPDRWRAPAIAIASCGAAAPLLFLTVSAIS